MAKNEKQEHPAIDWDKVSLSDLKCPNPKCKKIGGIRRNGHRRSGYHQLAMFRCGHCWYQFSERKIENQVMVGYTVALAKEPEAQPKYEGTEKDLAIIEKASQNAETALIINFAIEAKKAAMKASETLGRARLRGIIKEQYPQGLGDHTLSALIRLVEGGYYSQGE